MSTQILKAREVIEATFETTRMREGYNQDQVDDFLDLICETLKFYEKRPDTVAETPQVAIPGPQSDSALEAQAQELEQHRQALATFETELRAAERSLTDREASLRQMAERLAHEQETLDNARANAGRADGAEASSRERELLASERQTLRADRELLDSRIQDLKAGVESLTAQRATLESAMHKFAVEQNELRLAQAALDGDRAQVEELRAAQRNELARLEEARENAPTAPEEDTGRRGSDLLFDRRPNILGRPSWIEPSALPPEPISVEDALKTLADAGYTVTLGRADSAKHG